MTKRLIENRVRESVCRPLHHRTAIVILLAAVCQPTGLAHAELAQVDITKADVGLTGPGSALVVTAQRDPFTISIARHDASREAQPVIEGASVRYRLGDDGDWQALTRVIEASRRAQGMTLTCETDTGKRVLLTYELSGRTRLSCDIVFLDESPTWIEQRFPCAEGEHFYGLGDVWHTGSVDLRGKRVWMWARGGTPDECSYVPFFMSTAGYGMFFDEAREGHFDFGNSEPGVLSVRFRARRLRNYVFVDSTLLGTLKQYLDLTGYPPLPPDWTLGCQHWWNDSNEQQIREHTQMFLDHGIPLSAIWIDRPWALGADGSQDFIFDPGRFPDAPRLIEWLHGHGMRVMVWACDYMRPSSRDYAEAEAKGYLLSTGEKAIFDFSNPEAREWWKARIKRVLDLGVDGIKLDRGQSVPPDAVYPNGLTGAEMHNYHGYLMVKTYWEALREARGDDFQLTPRAGWAGTQAMSAKWPGDMANNFSIGNGLGAVIIAQQTAAATGFAFWGSDIGGFGRNPPKECYVRWLEFGCFSPLMEIVTKGDPPRPFMYDEETVEITREYAQLRRAMLPYLKATARQAHEEGVPMVRPLGLAYEDDDRAHEQTFEYMFGDALLVAPMYEPGTEREVYLPAGEWVDFWEPAKTFRGPTDLTVTVPLDRIPVFVKAGETHPLEMTPDEDRAK